MSRTSLRFSAHTPSRSTLRPVYRDIVEVIGREVGDDAVDEFIRRLVFCVLIGNGDAHLKNWALIYPDRCAPALAPAYDLVCTLAYLDDNRMALRWVDEVHRFGDLSEELLARLAAKARLPRKPVVMAARETVGRLKEVWGGEKAALEISSGVAKAIEANLGQVPLVGEV